jgi:hypothetical protein
MMRAGRIFINYRRGQSLAEAQHLATILSNDFGRPHVFIDVRGINGFSDWFETLRQQVEGSAAMISVIGPRWLDAADESGSRLDNPEDFVRFEIAEALRRGIPVLPVLLDGAALPPKTRLPAELHGMLRRQGMDLHAKRFPEDAAAISKLLRKVLAEERLPADIPYDAFISYNPKLDKPFVQRLQRQLQNLGKAWWQRRAVRVFRDESSLSAMPGLWPAIERALERSRFLIVCASPEAAASHWVNEEAKWWLEHKSRDTLLIALTAGDLRWDRTASDFVWNPATPLPPACKGAFAHEPKWTNFRAYRGLNEGDGSDAAFFGLAADLSSTIRGMPKEDLLSEEVRKQRRALLMASPPVVWC